jgi:hypothetical protein
MAAARCSCAMQRRGCLVGGLLALELGLATTASCIAYAFVDLFRGYSFVPDDPSPSPISIPKSAATLATQKAVFIDMFFKCIAFFAVVHSVAYVIYLVAPRARAKAVVLPIFEWRARLLRLVLLATFVTAWAPAWLALLIQDDSPRNPWEHVLAWLTVGAALFATLTSWNAAPGWPRRAMRAAGVALVASIGAARLRGSLDPSVFLAGVAVAWLAVDNGLDPYALC